MATDLQQDFDINDSSIANLFKIKYLQFHEATFNTATPTWNQIRKTNDFVGKRLEFPVPTSYQGGVGSSRLPETNVVDYRSVQLTSKKIYATDQIDRETIMASLSSEGAFRNAIAETIRTVVESDVWNHSRMLFNDSTGALGTIDAGGVTDNGGGDFDLVISTASYKEANWEERMFVNVDTGTEKFEVTAVDDSTRTISVQRQAGGVQTPAAAEIVYLQNSKDTDIQGLKGAVQATSGTLYNVTVDRKWQSHQQLSVGKGITPDLMNKSMLGVEKQVGKAPNMIATSYLQYEKILNQLEDKKRYQIVSMPSGVQGRKGEISFTGVQFMSAAGPVPIFPERFCEDDTMYFLNTDFITYFRRPNTGFVKDDIGGNGYLRVADEDKFEARFATYGELYISPSFQGVITGLNT